MQLLIDHQPIGRGMLDFDPLFATLAEIGFEGSIILEIDDRWPVATSVQRVRQLIESHLGWCRPPLVAEFAGEMVAVHE
ncbi:MAG: hypothetical protein DDT31_00439 [Syntrophomonadaceae bacterium]|nr:hypothetical protein [Bacillota bacterium]